MTTKTAASPEPRRVALVTGAANRIGAAIVLRLAEAGYKVVIHYHSSIESAKALVTTLADAGLAAALVRADLTRRAQRAALIGKAARPFGPLTVLVNNASLFDPDSVADLDETIWDRHFAIHAEAPMFLARDFAAQLPANQPGNIVNITDERVLHLTPNYFSYTLSKAVLATATTTLAQSLAPHIRVNAVGPGPTLAHKGRTEAAFQRAREALPLGYGANPAEIAEGVLYLLNSPAITGQMIAIDGGRHISFPERHGPTPRK